MPQKKPINPVVAGIIISAIMIIISLVIYFMDLYKYRALSWLGYLFMVVLLIVFVNLYGNAKNNEVSFGGLFGYGFKATLIISVLLPLFSFIFFMAFPEIKEKIFEMTRQGMEEQGNVSDEQIDQTIEMMRKNFTLFFIVFPILFYVFVGCVGSLIGAAITKKNPINPLTQQGGI